MSIQEHSNSPDSVTLLHEGNEISLDDGAQTITEGQIPKIRKPYTMTKQRERWSEEEHNNFLEALKLYGRAWRKIEEHVGTKTAVQIRSHAQKFFSKVVREPNNTNSSIKPAEIPPPRPKKKPIHPYPRKHVIPVKKDTLQEQSSRSTSPNSSLDQENQSPTTVLSAVVSETAGSSNSTSRDGSSSPVSSHGVASHNVELPIGADPVAEENVSQIHKATVPVILEPLPNVNSFTKESTVEEHSPKILKLFGQTVLLGSSGKTEEKSSKNDEESLENPSAMEVCTSAPVPLNTFCGGMPFHFIPFGHLDPPKEVMEEPETKKEGSSPGLNIVSVDARNWDTEMTQSVQCSLDFTRRLSAKLKRAASSENYTRAFVPYKRSLSERTAQSQKLTGEESEPPRTSLCL